MEEAKKSAEVAIQLMKEAVERKVETETSKNG